MAQVVTTETSSSKGTSQVTTVSPTSGSGTNVVGPSTETSSQQHGASTDTSTQTRQETTNTGKTKVHAIAHVKIRSEMRGSREPIDLTGGADLGPPVC